MNTLSLKKIMKVSIETYKENWKILLLISLLSAITSGSNEMIDKIVKVFGFQTSILLYLVSFAVMLLRIYLTGRLTVTLILSAKASLSYKKIFILDKFEEAKSLTWRYIGYSWVYGLIITLALAPLLFAAFLGSLFNMTMPIYILLFVIGIALSAYLGTKYYFALVTAVIHPEENNIFSYSKALVEGNFLKVLIIMIIPMISIFSSLGFNYVFNISNSSILIEFGLNAISKIPAILLMPFTMLLNLEAMKRLEGTKRVEEDLAS